MAKRKLGSAAGRQRAGSCCCVRQASSADGPARVLCVRAERSSLLWSAFASCCDGDMMGMGKHRELRGGYITQFLRLQNVKHMRLSLA